MNISLPHIFETIVHIVFLTTLLSITTCSRAIIGKSSIEPQLNDQMQEDLIQLEGKRKELHLQQREMLDRLREIERQVENE
jgi:hypothetical protein